MFCVPKDKILDLFLREHNSSKTRIAGLPKLLWAAFFILRKETIQLKINIIKVCVVEVHIFHQNLATRSRTKLHLCFQMNTSGIESIDEILSPEVSA